MLTPETVPKGNQNLLLVQSYGGRYVFNPHLTALPDAIPVTGFGHMKVITVDHRMPPETYFPAALDYAVDLQGDSTYCAAAESQRVRQFGRRRAHAREIWRANGEALQRPGVIAPGTPRSDATKQGDSLATKALVDNVLVSFDGFGDAATRFYAFGR